MAAASLAQHRRKQALGVGGVRHRVMSLASAHRGGARRRRRSWRHRSAALGSAWRS